jgi:hypothetical protein
MLNIQDYKNNTYSQNGEDGVLDAIFKQLKIENGYFVDVGAWDGVYLSNTYQFLERGWKGLDIEGNKNNFKGLIDTANNHPNLQIFYRMVQPDELDNLMDMHNVPQDFELLNIDIDTYDYWVWKNLNCHRPKVVVIESNGAHGNYIQPAVSGYRGKKGTDLEPLIALGYEKGYWFLGQVGNLFFMRDDVFIGSDMYEEKVDWKKYV